MQFKLHPLYDQAPLRDWISIGPLTESISPTGGQFQNLLVIASSNLERFRVVTRHTEYVYGKLMATPAPMVCARSLRDSWAFDCERKLIGRADLAEFEGRAATGRKLVDIHIPLQKLQLRAIDPTKSDVQLYEYACNSGMLPIKNANPAVNTDAAR